MFTWSGSPISFISLLVLFGLAGLWPLITFFPKRDWDTTMARIIEFLFALTAALMVTPPTADWLFHLSPDPALGFIYGLFTLWFVVEVAVRRDSGRRSYATVALLLTTMTWHIATVSRATRNGLSAVQMGDPDVYRAVAGGSGALRVMAWVGVPLAIALVGAALRSLWGALGLLGPPRHPMPAWRHRGAHLAEFCACTGLLWSSAALLSPALPFMSALIV